MRCRVSLGLLLACEVVLAVLIGHEAGELEQRYRRSAEALLTDTARWIAAVLAPDLHTGTVSAERLQELLAPGQHAGAPLATICAHTELLEGPLASRQQRRCLTHIKAATGRIPTVVNRLLELTALEKGRRLSDRQLVRLVQVLAEAADTLAVELRAKHLTLTRTRPATAIVRGQQDLLVFAVVNLLQNAIAFSPESGAIEVALTDAGDAVELTLHDHGPGIPDYAHERLFEHFYSLPGSDGPPRSTGLGLTLVREIAELHHGRIDVTNHPEGGAIAYLRLPQA